MEHERAVSRRRLQDKTAVFVSVAIFLLALLPRMVALGRYITPDELIWVYRSVLFREALLQGRWADTLVAGHPGVVTTWLGTVGISLQLWLRPSDHAIYTWVTHLAALTPDNMAAFRQLAMLLSAGRLAVLGINSLGIVAIFWLARPLWGTWVAALAALLLALDPFVAGLSGLLHVDALMTTLSTLALLTLALAAKRQQAGRSGAAHILMAASGAAAALAVLTKTPALLLLPVAALFLFSSLLTRRQLTWRERLRPLLILGLIWVGAFVVVTAVALPALWTSPLVVVETLTRNANRHVEEALRPTFFLGQVAYDHGFLFYPVVLLWRMGPIALSGLVLLPLLTWRRRASASWTLLLLVMWAALFVVGISVAAKKFDRYVLPAIPALILLGTLGWGYWAQGRERRQRWGFAALSAIQFVYLLWFLAYPLAAYNPLMGGPFTAQRVLPLGWGEAISASGRWLSQKPDVVQQTAVAGIAPSLAPFFSGETLLAETRAPQEADYVIYTAGSQQSDPEGLAAATTDLELLHTLRYSGIDQGWIYRNPHPTPDVVAVTPLVAPLSFNNQVRLLATGQDVRQDVVRFVARWQLQQPNGRFTVKLTLRDDAGVTWQSLETPLLNETYFYPEHWVAGEMPMVTYRLNLPPAMPPADYQLELSLLDADGAQMPLLAENGRFQGVVFVAEDVTVLPTTTPPVVETLPLAQRSEARWMDGDLRLLGYESPQARVATGAPLPLRLTWQASAPLPPGLQLTVLLEDTLIGTLPLSRYDSGLWRAGEIVAEQTAVVMPPEQAAGVYELRIQPELADDTPLGQPLALGQVEVQAVERLYELPAAMATPIDVTFGEEVVLRGVAVETRIAEAGTAVPLTLYWQATTQPQQLLTAFLHLVDDQGNIVAQVDRWPGGIPSTTWAADQVIIDAHAIPLPEQLPPGVYRWVVGLYTAASGVRLPAATAQGDLIGDHVVLPLSLAVRAADD